MSRMFIYEHDDDVFKKDHLLPESRMNGGISAQPEYSAGALFKDILRSGLVEGITPFAWLNVSKITSIEHKDLDRFLVTLLKGTMDAACAKYYYTQELIYINRYLTPFFCIFLGLPGVPVPGHYTSNLYSKNGRLFFKTVIFNIHLPDLETEGYFCFPGSLVSEYEITRNGIKFSHLEISNSVLRDICFDFPQKKLDEDTTTFLNRLIKKAEQEESDRFTQTVQALSRALLNQPDYATIASLLTEFIKISFIPTNKQTEFKEYYTKSFATHVMNIILGLLADPFDISLRQNYLSAIAHMPIDSPARLFINTQVWKKGSEELSADGDPLQSALWIGAKNRFQQFLNDNSLPPALQVCAQKIFLIISEASTSTPHISHLAELLDAVRQSPENETLEKQCHQLMSDPQTPFAIRNVIREWNALLTDRFLPTHEDLIAISKRLSSACTTHSFLINVTTRCIQQAVSGSVPSDNFRRTQMQISTPLNVPEKRQIAMALHDVESLLREPNLLNEGDFTYRYDMLVCQLKTSLNPMLSTIGSAMAQLPLYFRSQTNFSSPKLVKDNSSERRLLDCVAAFELALEEAPPTAIKTSEEIFLHEISQKNCETAAGYLAAFDAILLTDIRIKGHSFEKGLFISDEIRRSCLEEIMSILPEQEHPALLDALSRPPYTDVLAFLAYYLNPSQVAWVCRYLAGPLQDAGFSLAVAHCGLEKNHATHAMRHLFEGEDGYLYIDSVLEDAYINNHTDNAWAALPVKMHYRYRLTNSAFEPCFVQFEQPAINKLYQTGIRHYHNKTQPPQATYFDALHQETAQVQRQQESQLGYSERQLRIFWEENNWWLSPRLREAMNGVLRTVNRYNDSASLVKIKKESVPRPSVSDVRVFLPTIIMLTQTCADDPLAFKQYHLLQQYPALPDTIKEAMQCVMDILKEPLDLHEKANALLKKIPASLADDKQRAVQSFLSQILNIPTPRYVLQQAIAQLIDAVALLIFTPESIDANFCTSYENLVAHLSYIDDLNLQQLSKQAAAISEILFNQDLSQAYDRLDQLKNAQANSLSYHLIHAVDQLEQYAQSLRGSSLNHRVLKTVRALNYTRARLRSVYHPQTVLDYEAFLAEEQDDATLHQLLLACHQAFEREIFEKAKELLQAQMSGMILPAGQRKAIHDMIAFTDKLSYSSSYTQQLLLTKILNVVRAAVQDPADTTHWQNEWHKCERAMREYPWGQTATSELFKLALGCFGIAGSIALIVVTLGIGVVPLVIGASVAAASMAGSGAIITHSGYQLHKGKGKFVRQVDAAMSPKKWQVGFFHSPEKRSGSLSNVGPSKEEAVAPQEARIDPLLSTPC